MCTGMAATGPPILVMVPRDVRCKTGLVVQVVLQMVEQPRGLAREEGSAAVRCEGKAKRKAKRKGRCPARPDCADLPELPRLAPCVVAVSLSAPSPRANGEVCCVLSRLLGKGGLCTTPAGGRCADLLGWLSSQPPAVTAL
jgi:hypothetical protein